MSEPIATYTSHPIARYRLGGFKFENGLLKLGTEDEVAKFEALLEALPPSEQIRVKKVDLAAAEAIVRERLATQGRTTQQVDSTVGERAGNAPKIGKGDLLKDQPAGDDDSKTKLLRLNIAK